MRPVFVYLTALLPLIRASLVHVKVVDCGNRQLADDKSNASKVGRDDVTACPCDRLGKCTEMTLEERLFVLCVYASREGIELVKVSSLTLALTRGDQQSVVMDEVGHDFDAAGSNCLATMCRIRVPIDPRFISDIASSTSLLVSGSVVLRQYSGDRRLKRGSRSEARHVRFTADCPLSSSTRSTMEAGKLDGDAIEGVQFFVVLMLIITVVVGFCCCITRKESPLRGAWCLRS